MVELKLKAHWYQDEAKDADEDRWIPQNSWGSYISFLDEEHQIIAEQQHIDVGMNYATVDLLDNGKFHVEVGDCGMYGGPRSEAFANDLGEAFEVANRMFSHMVGFEIVESKLGDIEG